MLFAQYNTFLKKTGKFLRFAPGCRRELKNRVDPQLKNGRVRNMRSAKDALSGKRFNYLPEGLFYSAKEEGMAGGTKSGAAALKPKFAHARASLHNVYIGRAGCR